jgi:hypothetical protein
LFQKYFLSRSTIEDWFKTYRQLLDQHHIHPGMIFNCDETMLKTIKRQAKVITRRDDPDPYTPYPDKEPEHITILNCISADGTSLTKPLIIFPLKTMPPLQHQVTDAFLISGQSSGWMTSPAFATYIAQYFAPEIDIKRRALGLPPDAPALILYDAASVHFGVDFDDLKRRFNIHVLLLPAHSSPVLQPLDMVVHGVFKQQVSKLFEYVEGESARDRRNRLCMIASLALSVALARLHILQSWVKTGLWPVNPDVPLRSGLIAREVVPLQPQPARGGPRGSRIDNCIVNGPSKLSFDQSACWRIPLSSLSPNTQS